ncbi:hypothetical protein ACM614_01055 [Streptomyces sp. 12297]
MNGRSRLTSRVPDGGGARWEWLGDRAGDDFVYLTVEDGGLGRTTGLQLYPSGAGAVEFRPDPDRPPSQQLTRVAAP